MNEDSRQPPLASRGGLKLEAALDAFGISVSGLTAADLGSSTGGFVDVLLRRGAKKVYAVEKGFGRLAWALRNDPRVIVLERTDATTVILPEPVDMITIDVGFTKQRQVIPHAVSLLRAGGSIVSLVKPQYEVGGRELVKGRLTDQLAESVVSRITTELRTMGINVVRCMASPVRGRQASALEFFLLIRGS
jgi:23S rRNA (cytidine1920-2'-O)/16S rRNA (cytidine1409-2'-O)-methyltransferase